MIWDRQFGFLKETLVAPVSRFEIMLGRTLGSATIATLQGIIIFLLTLLVGFRPYNYLNVTYRFTNNFFNGLVFYGIWNSHHLNHGRFSWFSADYELFSDAVIFLSGALFPLDGLPHFINVISHLNPLTYGVDGLRASLINLSHFNLNFDILILTLLSLIVLSIGSYLFSKIQV